MQRVCLLTSLLGIFVSTAATAVTTPYACQFVASAGLHFENGNWRKTSFALEEKFILVLKDGALTSDSAAKPMGISPNHIECGPALGFRISCSDTIRAGASLVFYPLSGGGGIAHLFGAEQEAGDQHKDDLIVAPFTCSKY